MTIVRASPDSRREFSVVTMAEEKERSASPEDKQRESREVGVGSQKEDVGPTVPGAGKPRIGPAEHPRVPGGPSFCQDKDDMVEMEDIQDCKVTQVEEAQTRRGEEEEE